MYLFSQKENIIMTIELNISIKTKLCLIFKNAYQSTTIIENCFGFGLGSGQR